MTEDTPQDPPAPDTADEVPTDEAALLVEDPTGENPYTGDDVTQEDGA